MVSIPHATGKSEFSQGPRGLFLPRATSHFCSLEPIISFGDLHEIIQIASEVTARQNLRSQQIKLACRLTSCLSGISCQRIESPHIPAPPWTLDSNGACFCLLRLRPSGVKFYQCYHGSFSHSQWRSQQTPSSSKSVLNHRLFPSILPLPLRQEAQLFCSCSSPEKR